MPCSRLSSLVIPLCLVARLACAQAAGTSSAPAASTAADATSTRSDDDGRTKYPWFLENSYFGFSVGYIDYPFSTLQLEPGFRANSVSVPHLAAEVVLFGHKFNRYFSAQTSYSRPGRFVRYQNVNGAGTDYSVWMAYGEFTARGHLPLNSRLSLYGDAGLAVMSRRGFTVNDVPAVKDAHGPAVMWGAGVEVAVSPTWDLVSGISYSPANDSIRQPRMLRTSGGVRYHMAPLSASRLADVAPGHPIFPEQVLQLSFATDSFGYGVNTFVSKTVPIFWGGHVQFRRGYAVNYQRNFFHTKKVFAFDLGMGVAQWRSQKSGDRIYSLSVYPLLRFTLLRTKAADAFVSYSLAGPSYLSRRVIDASYVGTNRFTFQDLIGFGFFTGPRRNIVIGMNISHFSNGNLLTANPGIAIPATFSLGYAF